MIQPLQVEICILFVTWANKTTSLRCHAYLWVRAPHIMSPPWKVLWLKLFWYLRGKMLHQKHESYKYVLRLKNNVDWITASQEKTSQTQKWYIFRRRSHKLWKKFIFPLMTTFYNFTFKVDTSWAKKVLNPIFETWKNKDVIVYVWFIYSRIKWN